MIILLHVIIALSSIGLTSYAYFRPSKSKLGFAYGSIAATIASGLFLVWSEPAHMMQACMSGLAYLGIVSVGIVAAHAKLATLQTESSFKKY